jgi:hypothetical protein
MKGKRIMKPSFTKKMIATINNDFGSSPMNTFLAAGDLNNDGRLDLIVSGWTGVMVWLENRGESSWIKHVMDDQVKNVECGGCLYDLTGNGYLDVICGSADEGEVWWWENPGKPDIQWKKHTILKTDRNFFHDTAIGDVTHDGRLSLVLNNQCRPEGTTIFCVPIPKDPSQSPWPDVQVIAENKLEWLETPDGELAKEQAEEGLAIGDIDGDGLNEVVSGTHWYKYENGQWKGHKFASGYITNKVAIGDVDGDGQKEIVLSEGDPMIYGKIQGGRLGWFKPGKDINALWEEHILEDGLIDAHTLQLADMSGNGRVDIIIGEIGWADKNRGYRRRDPWVLVYENLGDGKFARHIIDQGTGSHEGLVLDLRNCGKLDFVCKPLHGPDRWNIVVLENNS